MAWWLGRRFILYRCILFDLDGTLLDTLQDLAEAGNHTLSVMGFPRHPIAAYQQMVGNGIPKLVWRMLPEQNRQESTLELAYSLFQRHYQAHMLDNTAPYPGILDTLQRLKEAGYPLGVSSNKADTYTQKIVSTFFPNTFCSVAGLTPPFPAKPDPTLALHQMAQMGGTPGTTLYIGDSDVDMFTARNAGFVGCGVLWGFRSGRELLQAGADLIAETPAELIEHILT